MSAAAATAPTSIVEVRGLVKRFGEFTAVDGVSFEIAEGEIFGLLGPNGAGKTTTISMISCLIAPDEGDVLVDGHSVRTRLDRRAARAGHRAAGDRALPHAHRRREPRASGAACTGCPASSSPRRSTTG